MRSVKLLDCTLRDGGFVNGWRFGLGAARDVVYRLAAAGLDMVELGYLDESAAADEDRTRLPGTACFKPLLAHIRPAGGPRPVVMTDYGSCALSLIQDRALTGLFGLRITFKKREIEEALDYAARVKEKGYHIYLQPVSVTSYGEDEITDLVRRVNRLGADGLSLVDTYGLLFKNDLSRYFRLIDKNLNPEIHIGYHAHNNFQLASANCMELLSLAGERNLILDASLYGMGKGAGNALTEVLAAYLNSAHGGEYDLTQLTTAIDLDILRFFRETPWWGYSLPFFLSALNRCHPSYIQYWLDLGTLPVKSINEIAGRLPEGDKLAYDGQVAAGLTRAYLRTEMNDVDDAETLRAALKGRDILILASGPSLEERKETIKEYIKERAPVVFAVNFIPLRDYRPDYIFFGNARRYIQFSALYRLADYPLSIIAVSDITPGEIPVDLFFDRASLAPPDSPNNSVIFLINLLTRLGAGAAALAGFDGFSPDGPAHGDDWLDQAIRPEARELFNRETGDWLRAQKAARLHFITPTMYNP